MTLVTPHFHIEEFDCRDGTPYPPEWVEVRLRPLCETLEEVRERWGKPLVITSGFRTATWNEAVGGQINSRHLLGDAADFIIPGIDADAVHEECLQLQELGIIHCGGLAIYHQRVSFVHIDIRGKRVRWIGNSGQVPL